MNIKQAKNHIKNTLKAYLTKDGLGNYLIPSVRQRPVLLIGPPGIGKTQIMEQIASEEGVGLVSYTITHHTRQSAMGLPFISKQLFGGVEYTVTEYTMSEIIGSVYRLMENTGIREGILFLDEINCVSETLSPMMLQFLQCKTFGNQKLPEGWLIVAAGNPPEYNKSVREFDVVTLDRVRKITVEEDYGVWKEYALQRGLHGAVISYLDLKKDNFYRMENTPEGMQFATARGWEDLSEIIYAYEKLSIPVDFDAVSQYISLPEVARDFAAYLSLYYKYNETWHIDEILAGTWSKVTAADFTAAPMDEKIAVMSLLLAGISDEARKVRFEDAVADALYGSLTEVKNAGDGMSLKERLHEEAQKGREELKRRHDAGQNDRIASAVLQKKILLLEEFEKEQNPTDAKEQGMERIREKFSRITGAAEELAGKTADTFDHVFQFLEQSVGQSQELVIFLTEVTAGYDTSWFIGEYGCDAYYRHNKELLFTDRRRDLMSRIAREKL